MRHLRAAFVHTDGSGAGDANNTLASSNFRLGGRSAGVADGLLSTGGASGNRDGAVSASDIAFLNVFASFFTADARLSLDISLATIAGAGDTLDQFALVMPQSDGSVIGTQDPTGVHSVLTVGGDSREPLFNAYAADFGPAPTVMELQTTPKPGALPPLSTALMTAPWPRTIAHLATAGPRRSSDRRPHGPRPLIRRPAAVVRSPPFRKRPATQAGRVPMDRRPERFRARVDLDRTGAVMVGVAPPLRARSCDNRAPRRQALATTGRAARSPGIPLDPHTLLIAVVLGVVEGLTEFLPVSSTGHLIVAGSLLGYVSEQAKIFEIAIQSGAMLAIVWEYRARFARVIAGLGSEAAARRFVVNLVIAFVPAAVCGLLFGRVIKDALFRPVPVAMAFVVGALVILWAERRQKARPGAVRIGSVDDMRWSDALKVGVAQAFALIPGTSRSGATIIGGMLFGLSRTAATEFSFFLAVPTLVAAGAYSLWKDRALLSGGDVPMFAVGFVVSFVAALACVRWLIRYVSHHDFIPFVWYRILFGGVILVTAWMGVVRWD